MSETEQLPGAIVLEGHVQGLSNVRSLGELGIPVYVIDQNRCLAQYSKYCTEHFPCPAYSSNEFPEFLIELAQRKGLRGWFLIASNDHIVEQLSKNKDRLTPYYSFFAPSIDDLERIIDKRLLMQEARKCGTHIPETFSLDNLPGNSTLHFPLLIKGSRGLTFCKKTHKKAIQVNDQDELNASLDSLKEVLLPSEFMIQELIPSRQNEYVVSFTCFAEDGEIKTYWMGRKLREHPIQYGTATLAESVMENEILQEAGPLVQQLSYTGICEIEFLRDERDGVFKLIEINPRTWLWVGLAKACGIDYAKIAYRFINGIPQSFPSDYTVGLKWINRLTDLVFAVKALFSKVISLKDYRASLKGKKVFAIWSWNDPLPGIVFPFMSIYIARKRS